MIYHSRLTSIFRNLRMILTQNLEAEISFRHARYKCESFQIGIAGGNKRNTTSRLSPDCLSGGVYITEDLRKSKRRLTANSVHMGAGNFLSHYMGMRRHFPGNDFV